MTFHIAISFLFYSFTVRVLYVVLPTFLWYILLSASILVVRINYHDSSFPFLMYCCSSVSFHVTVVLACSVGARLALSRYATS